MTGSAEHPPAMSGRNGPQLLALGPLDLRRGVVSLALGSHKQRAVLALLALHEGRVVGMGDIVDGIWGDDPPPTVVTAVQVYVTGVRKALGAAALGGCLITRTPGYLLRLPEGCWDISRFDGHLADATAAVRARDWPTASDHHAKAFALWRGTPLADFPEPFAEPWRRRLIERYRGARVEWLRLQLRLGLAAEVVGHVEAELAEVPFDERLWHVLAHALYALGRQADALEALRRARALLADELGVDPGPDLVALERGILIQDAGLRLPVRSSTAGGSLLSTALPATRRPCLVTPDGTHIPLWRRALMIGRHVNCDVVLDHPDVSRRHCRILVDSDRHIVVDLGSTNGTWVNGERVDPDQAGAVLSFGDRLELGPFALRFDRLDQRLVPDERTTKA